MHFPVRSSSLLDEDVQLQPMAVIEFVDRDVEAKGAADRARLAAEEAAESEAASA